MILWVWERHTLGLYSPSAARKLRLGRAEQGLVCGVRGALDGATGHCIAPSLCPGHSSPLLAAAGETLFLWPVFTIHIYRHAASAQPGLGLLLTINCWSGESRSVIPHCSYKLGISPPASTLTAYNQFRNVKLPWFGRMMNSNKNLEEWERVLLVDAVAIIARDTWDTRENVTHIAKATGG